VATFRITVRKHQKRKDGKIPISIRLTHQSNVRLFADKLDGIELKNFRLRFKEEFCFNDLKVLK